MKIKEEGKDKIFVSTLVIVGMLIICTISFSVSGAGDLPYYDIEQDSLGNYHKAFIDNSVGNYELYYTNDIGGSFPQDWNPPTRITYSTNESYLVDLGIYTPTDTMFMIWLESPEIINTSNPLPTSPIYYSLSRDYGTTWTAPNRSWENIMLKFAEFDPLFEEPEVPDLPDNWASPYAYYIVQLKTPTIQEWVDGIENAGGVFCGYIGQNAYITWMTPQVKEQIEQLPYIRWIDYYHPLYRIQPGLLDKTGVVELNVMVIEETGGLGNIDKVILEIETLGGIIIYNGYDNFIIHVQIDASKIYDIAMIPDVEWIDEWKPPVIYMNNVRDYTGVDTLYNNIPQFRGEDIVGEVKDDGVDQTHPDYTVEGTEGTVTDEAHGTCSFGTIFSTGLGDEDARGMLPQAKGYFCNYLEPRQTSIENLVTNWGGMFQSNSWGSGFLDGDYSVISYQNDQAVYDNRITMVYAVGNSKNGVGASTIDQDSAAKNVISVGGIDHNDDAIWDSNDRWVDRGAEFTPSQGPAADGRFKPDLCGPADHGYVTDSVDDDGQNGYRTGNYVTKDITDRRFGRTSLATAVVGGASGLVYEMYRANHFGNNPGGGNPQASTVKALLIANAHQIDVGDPGLNAADGDGRYQQGWGSVDIGRVYEVGRNHFIVNEDHPNDMMQVAIYDIYVQSDEPLKISLVWTDAPGAPSSDTALVNDLLLVVRPPSFISGQDEMYYYGNNGLENSLWSISCSDSYPFEFYDKQDAINNVENVFIEIPEEGHWKIEVLTRAIQGDGHPATPRWDQSFALVASYKPAIPVQLYQGTNLISLPLEQENPNIETVLSDVLPYVSRVDYYDASDPSDPWKMWPGELQQLHHYMGFYIEIDGISEITLIVRGNPFTENEIFRSLGHVPVPLSRNTGTGWNMVGYPSNREGVMRWEALTNLVWDTHIDQVMLYDTSLGKDRKMRANEEFELGRGYFFHIPELPPSHEWEVEIDI